MEYSHPLPEGSVVRVKRRAVAPPEGPTVFKATELVDTLVGRILEANVFTGYIHLPVFYSVLFASPPAPEGSGVGQIRTIWADDIDAVIGMGQRAEVVEVSGD